MVGHGETAKLGSLVRVRDGDIVESWRIVPVGESDLRNRCIEESTPLARALLGHRIDDQAVVRVAGSSRPVTILSIG